MGTSTTEEGVAILGIFSVTNRLLINDCVLCLFDKIYLVVMQATNI